MQPEITLAILPSENEDERLQLVLNSDNGSSALSLLQQSWCEGVGWYTQTALQLSPSQVRQLRLALGRPAAQPVQPIVPVVDPADVVSVPFAAARAESA